MRMIGLFIVAVGGLLLSGCNGETKAFDDMSEARKYQKYCINDKRGTVYITTNETLNTVTITCRYK